VEPLVHVLALSPHEREAIQLLGQMQAKDAIEPLVRLLDPQSEELDFQLAILEALVQIGEAHIAEQLVPLVHPETQWALFETLEQRWKAEPPVLQPTFRNHVDPAFSQGVRACTFQKKLLASLGRLGNPRIVEALLNKLTPHAKFGYRGDFYLSLLDVLGKLGDKRAIEPLARLLTRELQLREWHFQQGLVRALRQLGDTRAELEAVEKTLQQLAEDYHRQTGIWLGAG
jgi:HEAT repeat protein